MRPLWLRPPGGDLCPVGLAVIDAPWGVRARKLSERQYRDRQQITVGS